MENTQILMGLTFFGIFFSFLIYNYISSLVLSGTLLNSCPDFTSQFNQLTTLSFSKSTVTNPTGCNPLDVDCKVGGGFSQGGGQGGGGGSSGARGTSNWWDFIVDPLNGILNFFKGITSWIGNALSTLTDFTSKMLGIMGSFFLIFTTGCEAILPIRIFLMAVFIPFIIGFLYITVRLIKSMIPTVGGD